MSKPLLQLAALGLLGFSLWKVGSFFFIPLLFLAFKIALVVGIVLFAVWLFKRNDGKKASDDSETAAARSLAPADRGRSLRSSGPWRRNSTVAPSTRNGTMRSNAAGGVCNSSHAPSAPPTRLGAAKPITQRRAPPSSRR